MTVFRRPHFARFAATALMFGTATALRAGDWPQFLGPERNGTSSETGLKLEWGKDGPPLSWERKLGTGWAGPVVAGGRVVVFHRVENAAVVECLDGATGKPQWKFEYPTDYRDDFRFDDGPRATPLVADGRVYTLGAEGRLHCLKLDDGAKVWDRDLVADYEPKKGYFGVATSPLLDGGRLMVNVGGKGAGVVAFDPATGKEVWKATDQEASYSSPTAATIDGVRHALFFTRAGLLSLDPADGKERFALPWRARIQASVNAATPLVVGDQLFLSSEYSTGATVLNVRKDGVEKVWKSLESMNNHYNTCVPYRGYLYGIDGRQEGGGRLRCVEWKTGAVRWTEEGFGCAALIRTGEQLVTVTEKGDAVAFAATPDGYREAARGSVLTAPVRAAPALADGRLYARDGKRLACWDLKKPTPKE